MAEPLVHELLVRAARSQPDQVAVEEHDRAISYRELDAITNRVARRLRVLGVEPGDRVAILIEKSIEAVIAIYGILKAGAAYVPLDPQAPIARLAGIVEDCAVRCVVSESRAAASWPAMIDACPSIDGVVVLDDEPELADATASPPIIGRVAIAAESAEPIDAGVAEADLAYILYTSGSTGRSKGVALSHGNALAFVGWAVDTFGVTARDRLSNHAPFHFDLSVFDLYASAHACATVVLVPPRTSRFPIEVARFIDRCGITVWYSVPSLLTQLVRRGGLTRGELPSLRAVLFAGEVFPTKFLRQLIHLLPEARFANLYGPTETNVCTWYDVPALGPESAEDIPIGRPIANVETIVVTEQGKVARRGEVGELYVRGPTVMRGYWGDAERTERALVRLPPEFGRGSDLAYRTGDLVREDEGGNLRLLGRRDNQVKSRGYRIELGEIETALNAHGSVVECAVVAVPDELVTNRIKAFVSTTSDVSSAELARWCADFMPRYMIPESIELRSTLPKTSTGKIDRQELRAAAAG